MRFSMILAVIIFVFMPLSDLYAGTIYSWTDKNGVKKYSNTAPEDDIEDLEIVEEISSPETDDSGVEIKEKEDEYRQEGMTDAEADDKDDIGRDELSYTIREMEAEKKERETTDSETEKTAIADDRFNEKVQAEEKRLQGEIDRIDKLAVGKSLSLARKNAMIKQFQDKLELLLKSPEEYFSAGPTE